MAYASQNGGAWLSSTYSPPKPGTPRSGTVSRPVGLKNGFGQVQEIFPAYLERDKKAKCPFTYYRPTSGRTFHHICPGTQYWNHPPVLDRYSPDLESNMAATMFSEGRFRESDLDRPCTPASTWSHGSGTGWCDNNDSILPGKTSWAPQEGNTFNTSYKDFHENGHCVPRVRPGSAQRLTRTRCEPTKPLRARPLSSRANRGRWNP
eukprot:TRINITY_DN16438_c0_g3_i3.p1 TRINITY_DN16438_c0_g3~~TRINITY_DN16438_c0_g3_i3.p1  ORF type:complete len:206 (-),score=17.12 TRINITY_DN16438_c0_g3_i3:41-658(-)